MPGQCGHPFDPNVGEEIIEAEVVEGCDELFAFDFSLFAFVVRHDNNEPGVEPLVCSLDIGKCPRLEVPQDARAAAYILCEEKGDMGERQHELFQEYRVDRSIGELVTRADKSRKYGSGYGYPE